MMLVMMEKKGREHVDGEPKMVQRKQQESKGKEEKGRGRRRRA